MTKHKLPSDVAFPVKVSKLQEKLLSVPQHSEISIVCSYVKEMSPRRLEKTKYGKSNRIIKNNSLEIMKASYSLKAVSMTTPNAWLKENSWKNNFSYHRWEVVVRAVPTADLTLVRDLLEREGFARLQQWFKDTHKYSQTIGEHSLLISFDGTKLTYKQYDSA